MATMTEGTARYAITRLLDSANNTASILGDSGTLEEAYICMYRENLENMKTIAYMLDFETENDSSMREPIGKLIAAMEEQLNSAAEALSAFEELNTSDREMLEQLNDIMPALQELRFWPLSLSTAARACLMLNTICSDPEEGSDEQTRPNRTIRYILGRSKVKLRFDLSIEHADDVYMFVSDGCEVLVVSYKGKKPVLVAPFGCRDDKLERFYAIKRSGTVLIDMDEFNIRESPYWDLSWR